MFHYAKQNNIPGLMLQLDFSKAFDSISFQYIESTLKLFVFCDTIIHWMFTLLNNFKSVTMPNGNISFQITVGKDFRQGNSIAGYLLGIALKIIAQLQGCDFYGIFSGPQTICCKLFGCL